jgi:hypothetical protein
VDWPVELPAAPCVIPLPARAPSMSVSEAPRHMNLLHCFAGRASMFNDIPTSSFNLQERHDGDSANNYHLDV